MHLIEAHLALGRAVMELNTRTYRNRVDHNCDLGNAPTHDYTTDAQMILE